MWQLWKNMYLLLFYYHLFIIYTIYIIYNLYYNLYYNLFIILKEYPFKQHDYYH